MNNPINIGVVGLGRLGRLYARYFTNRLPGARLHSVTDVQPDAVRATVAETGAKGFATTAEMLADKALDVLEPRGSSRDGVARFGTAELRGERSGRHGYAVRVTPRHPSLPTPFPLDLVRWSD